MSKAAASATSRASRITPAATAIAPSVRTRNGQNGWKAARPNCFQWNTSTLSSPFPNRLPASRFGSGAEENAVEHRGVIKRDAGNLFGNGEDHVEVFHWQQFGLAAFQPFCPFRVLTLGAMAVTAGVIRDAREIALAAAFDMAA